jgi:hypothetical protein
MALRAEARAWWAEVEEVQMRERIERRVAADRARARKRGRRRPLRRPVERVEARPDRLAEWAAAMAFLLVVVAVLSTRV